MPAKTKRVLKAEKHIETAAPTLPTYIQDFIVAKRDRLSPNTLSGYIYDYTHFLNWLKIEGFTDKEDIKDIPHTVLENISKQDIESFFSSLRHEPITKSNKDTDYEVKVTRSKSSVQRYVQSLKSLYNYLTQETDIDGECLFYRNVMAKIKSEKNNVSKSRRARKINAKTLKGPRIEEFLEFVEFEYEKNLSKRQLHSFNQNKVRDLAILSLLLGSGIRGNELVGLLVDDINFLEETVDVFRKDDKEDTVAIRPSSLSYLEQYLKIRESTYKPDRQNKYLFLTIHENKTKNMSNDALIQLTKKYTKAFGMELTPHKLRHSFSKRYLDDGGSMIGLRDQLGHNTIETTSLYTNESLEEQRNVLYQMDGIKTK